MSRIRTRTQAADIRYGIRIGKLWASAGLGSDLAGRYAESVLGGNLIARAFMRSYVGRKS